jgi:Flp pilus assembly protein TadG
MQDRGYGTVVTRVECEAGSRPFRKALTKLRRAGCGQAFVEFAIMAPLALMLILVGIQFAIIGTASLGLGQVNYQGARYAANNTSASAAAVQSYMLSVASPIIGANSGSYLTSSLSPAPPCAFGATVTVAVTFDTRHLVLLPNPFLGIPFPTTLTNSESAFCE